MIYENIKPLGITPVPNDEMNYGGMVIRPFAPAIDSVERLNHMINLAYQVHLPDVRFGGAFQRPNDTLMRTLGGFCYVAEVGDQILGTAIYTPSQMYRLSREPGFEGHGEISQFAVNPVMHRSGIGYAILSFVNQLAAETGDQGLALTTLAQASGLVRYYERRGFKTVHRFGLGFSEHALMTKKTSEPIKGK